MTAVPTAFGRNSQGQGKKQQESYNEKNFSGKIVVQITSSRYEVKHLTFY
jgi:hypothetical protein